MIYTDENIFSDIELSSDNSFQNLEKIITTDEEKKKIVLNNISSLKRSIAEGINMERISFLFGNGSSIYAGTKAINNSSIDSFLQDDFDDCLKIKEYLTGKTLEEKLNVLIICSEFYNINGNIESKEAVDNCIANIKTDLIENNVNGLMYDQLSYHNILLLKLRSIGALNRTSIYTLNYDMAFEYSLDKLFIEYNNGFTGFINRKFNIKSLYDSDKLKLIKIHGSVNWKLRNGEIYELQDYINSSDKEVLIYPTSKKMEQTFNSPYSDLMRCMLDEFIDKKNMIIVLGYKYADAHINDIFMKSLANPNNIFYFFYFDIDKDNDFINKIKEISNTLSNVNIIEGKILASFEFFTKYILPSNPNHTDDELIAELLKRVLYKNE